MTQCCHHLHESTNELGASHSRVSGLACSGFVLVLCVLVLFCVSLLFAWFMMMTAQWTYCTGPPPVLFCGLNSRWPGTLICITAHAMSYSLVNDLAKAMKALTGKKSARIPVLKFSISNALKSTTNVGSKFCKRSCANIALSMVDCFTPSSSLLLKQSMITS